MASRSTGVVTQTAVAVMAEIQPDREAALREQLERAGPGGQPADRVPFDQLPTVHFARFFVVPTSQDLRGQPLTPRLLFLANVDGPAEPFLRQLCALASGPLDRLYAHCRGYPGPTSLPEFLERQRVPVAAEYTNTIGRTVEQIRAEAALREAIERFLDRTADRWRGADPRRVRSAIQQYVREDPALAWAARPAPGPDLPYLLGEWGHLLLVLGGAILALPIVGLGLPIYLYLLRWHETRDQSRDVVPDDAWVQALAAQQDSAVQNPFTSVGFLKPGLFRRFTASLVLFTTGVLTRHVFKRANLLGVKTIHFAQWIFLDDKRRVVFCSNYDGSLESYMDDFVDKIAWALNAAFSNGVDYPPTSWLILEGANDEQRFKRFNLTHQLLTQLWYAAYPSLTALNIENNARIRAGLCGPMDRAAARAWLARF
jgi:hypothetical protein